MTESVHHQTLREELQQLGLWELLEDENNTDVMVNPDGTVHVFGYSGLTLLPERLPAEPLRTCLATIAGIHRRVLDDDHPILEVSLPQNRVRVTAVIPPVASAPTLACRIPPRRLLTVDDLIERGSFTPELRELLLDSLLAGETCVISGAVSSGKTVLASALLSELVRRRPEERLVVIEDGARELQLPEDANVNALLTPTTLELSTDHLLKVSLRLNPDRIIIGELRGGEALTFVKSALSGHPGLATLHANSPQDAIARLSDLLEEAGSPPSPLRVARSVRLIVQIVRRRFHRRVEEVLRLAPPDHQGHFDTEVVYRAPPTEPFP